MTQAGSGRHQSLAISQPGISWRIAYFLFASGMALMTDSAWIAGWVRLLGEHMDMLQRSGCEWERNGNFEYI